MNCIADYDRHAEGERPIGIKINPVLAGPGPDRDSNRINSRAIRRDDDSGKQAVVGRPSPDHDDPAALGRHHHDGVFWSGAARFQNEDGPNRSGRRRSWPEILWEDARGGLPGRGAATSGQK